MLHHRKLRSVVAHAHTSQTFAKTTPEVSFSFTNVKNWASAAGYAVNKIPRLVRMWKKNALYLSVNVFSTKVLIGDTIFYFSYWRGDRHFTWSSEPREGLAACSTKVVPSFLSYFKTLSISPAPGMRRTRDLPLCSHTLHLLSEHCRGWKFCSRNPLTSMLNEWHARSRRTQWTVAKVFSNGCSTSWRLTVALMWVRRVGFLVIVKKKKCPSIIERKNCSNKYWRL